MIRDSRTLPAKREPLTRFDRLFLLSLTGGLALFWAIVGFWVLRHLAP